jgi:hypothetical protein
MLYRVLYFMLNNLNDNLLNSIYVWSFLANQLFLLVYEPVSACLYVCLSVCLSVLISLNFCYLFLWLFLCVFSFIGLSVFLSSNNICKIK